MKKPSSLIRNLLWAGGSLAAVILLAVASIFVDTIPAAEAMPPKNMQTLADFKNWKGDAIVGEGIWERDGVVYTIMLGPAGRYLASGPSAYLFNEQGRFVDWTYDMGDFTTAKNSFRVDGGKFSYIPGKSW